jgi:hypothetical protein
MTGGLLAYIFEAAELQRDTGCTADEAFEIVHAAHAYEERDEPETIGNVIYVDFRPRGLSDAVA